MVNNFWLTLYIDASPIEIMQIITVVHHQLAAQYLKARQARGGSLFSNQIPRVPVVCPSPTLPRLHNALLIFSYCIVYPAAILMSHPVRPRDARILLSRRRGKRFWTSAVAVSPGNAFRPQRWRDEEAIDCNGAMEESNLASLKI